jgi:hypothetical protein
MSNTNIIKLEGTSTPDILLSENEEVLMDISQGFRDLGLMGMILRHKGRLIVTNKRAVYLKKKTKDFEISQLNMMHSGYVGLGHDFKIRQFIVGISLLLTAISTFVTYGESLGTVILLFSLFVLLTSRVQGLVLSGSGEKIHFVSKSVSKEEMSKILTATIANS